MENENNEYALNKKKIKNESHSISFKTEDTLNMKEFFPLGSTIKKQEQPSNTKKTEKNKILIKSEIDEEINIQNLKENKLWIKALDLLVIDYDRFVRNIENVDSFCNLDSPFDQYNILMIQKQIFFNSKILKLVVYLKDFEIYNDIVKAKLIVIY